MFTILELIDTYVGYHIFLLFIFSSLLLRNYIFNFFKNVKCKILSSISKENQELQQNSTKDLSNQSYNSLNTISTSSLKSNNNFLKK